ncbi:hypothetical protein CEQ90_06070 [Lewinellaceae bacterium SD302]|nr:hypothetical protein CEQ90_06070 [Lewinellaceae bacterium SD302]
MPTYLSQQQVDHYYQKGYVHVPAVYTPEAVDRARELIEEDVATGGWTSAPHHDEGVTTDIYERMPELAEIVFNENYLRAMDDIFGKEAIVLAEPAIHRGRYYYWHKDSTFIDEQGEDYHWKKDFQAAMTVLYLQPNHPEFGGGITVVPETHTEPDFYHRIPKMSMVERGILKAQKIAGISHFDKLDKHPRLHQIQSEKGDLLVLDMRVDHKGTPAIKPVPYTKYGIMNIACTGEQTAERLRATLRRRSSGYYKNYLAKEPRTTPVLEKIGKEKGSTIWL